jgi:MFS family permease
MARALADAGQTSGALQEWRAGWRSVASAGIAMATGLALFAYVVSLFIREYVRDFGWTRGEIALSAFATVAASLATPVIGRWADLHGVRPVVIVSTLGFGTACVGMANQTGDIRLYYALYFLLVLFGMGTASVAWTRVVGVAFERSRGLALSVSLSLITVSAFLMPPILQSIIADHGWRAAWYVLGGYCVVGAAIGLMLMPAQPKVVPGQAAGISGFRTAVRVPAFWLAVGGMYLINIPSGGLMNQMAALIDDKGFSEVDAARVMSAFAVSVFVGRLIAGACLDRFPARIVAFVSMVLPAFGCVLLAGGWEPVLALTLMGIGLAGVSQGAEGDVGPYVIAQRFGFSAFSGMMGALGAATACGTATGAVLFGQTHDRTGTYDAALWIGACAFVLGALCYLAIGAGKAAAGETRGA